MTVILSLEALVNGDLTRRHPHEMARDLYVAGHIDADELDDRLEQTP